MSDFEERLVRALNDGADGAPGGAGLAEGARRRSRGRRRGRVMVVGAAVAVAAIAAPVAIFLGSDGDAPPASPAPTSESEAGPKVTCGGGASWPAALMDGGLTDRVDPDEVDRALTQIREEAPLDAPRGSWIVLAASDDEVVLGMGPWSAQRGPGPGAQNAVLRSSEDGRLEVVGWGDCHLAVALPEGQTQVEVTAPRDGVDAGTTDPVVLVNERQCTSSRDPRPFLSEATVVETDDRVVVTLSADAITGNVTCPGNPSVPVTLRLDEAIGEREVVDGGTWPPTPIEVRGSTWQTVELDGVAVDVPGDWAVEPECAGLSLAVGPGARDSCPPTVSVSVGASAPHSDDLPGLDTGFVRVGDLVVAVRGVDLPLARRILGSARPSGDPAPAVESWTTLTLENGVTAQVPDGPDVAVQVLGIARCVAGRSAAELLPDRHWRASLCRGRIVHVKAPTQALADVVASTVQIPD